jgi:protease-4
MARRGFTVLFTILGIAVFISMAGFALLYVLFGREPAVPSRSTLVLNVGGDLSEMEPADVFGYLRGGKRPTVRGVIDNLRKAKVDTRVRAVLLKPTGFTSPFWSKVQEIREAVIDFRKSGKPIYAYLEYGGDREYYLATAADKVFLMPSSPLDLVGVATYQLFLRGTLDKIGATPDLHHIGTYKTAVNTFTQKGYTPAHREMDESLNRDLYEQIVRGIADGRKKHEEEIRALIDDGPFMPEDALRAGLVDDIAYEDQVDEKLRGGDRVTRMDADEYTRVSLTSLGLNKGPRIGVIYAAGAIASGKSGFDPVNGAVAGSDTLIEYIRRARRDNSLRAIVLRIDSPGLRRHLARADACAPGKNRSAADRLHVRSGGVGRLLHRHAGADHRRRAIDADRLDWDFRGQDRDRGRVRKTRRADRLDQRRQARRDQFARPPVQSRRAEEAAGAAAGILRPVRGKGGRLPAYDA